MGIDYSGGMIVGAHGSDVQTGVDIDFDDNEEYEYIDEWIEEHGMTTMSQHYDADIDYQYVGFEVSNVLVHEMEGEWLTNVKKLAAKFKDLTGVEAKLIGTQNIW
ncbi:MAG: hypothetical protein GY800_09105 [Planctomycetes bacterium]|nr:hypothetical protein [Planctomycetota bacterium]